MSEKSEFDIYLASASPRRRELLAQIGVRYRVVEVDVDETVKAGEVAKDYVVRLALAKARAGWNMTHEKPHPVLGADTAVVVDDQILGKPKDKADALNMLALLSGRSHQVMSGIALVGESTLTAVNISTVTFRTISDSERAAYWASGECQDKAGSYAVQGHAALFIRELQGSYSGVMGLPLYETGQLLENFGVKMMQNKVFSK